jgi:hypothetical protein
MAQPVELTSALRGPDPTWQISVTWRRVLILVPPLLLAGLEVFHPQPDANAQAVMDVSTWFAGFHAIQLVLIGPLALSAMLLANSYGRANTWTTRLGIGAFLVFFSAYDAVAGIAMGLAMRSARDLTTLQQEGVLDAVKDWPAFGPPFALSIIGSAGWAIAIGVLALAARRHGAPRREWIFIGLAAFFLLGGHPFPAGTLAFGCFFIAAFFREFKPATAHQDSMPTQP